MERIFGSRIRAKTLGWFYTHADEAYFVRQLASILKEDSTNLSRELSSLEKASILSSTRQGNLKLFRANPQCPFFAELKGLVLKTVGVFGEINAYSGPIRPLIPLGSRPPIPVDPGHPFRWESAT